VRNVAEAVRPDVRASLDPTPLYPFKRINPPTMHAQLYAASETPGRPTMHAERDGLLYLNLFSMREQDIDSLYSSVQWLDGWTAEGEGVAAIHYRLASANLLEEDDGTLHLACIYSTRYYRSNAA
jgi:hypothetical protein